MSKQLFFVTDIRLIEPVEGTHDDHPLEDLENFKKYIESVLSKMVTEDVIIEVQVSTGYQVEEDEENEG